MRSRVRSATLFLNSMRSSSNQGVQVRRTIAFIYVVVVVVKAEKNCSQAKKKEELRFTPGVQNAI
jgi:hypothetical protein